MVTRDEMLEIQWLLQDHVGCFTFSLKELGHLRGQEVWIVLEDDNPIFKQPYRLSEMERALVQARTAELLNASLVELLKGDYALAIAMQLDWVTHVWGLSPNQ